MANGTILTASELYNVLACFGAEKDPDTEKYIVRGHITSFLGMGDEFVLDDTAQYRKNGEWQNLLHAIKTTSYYHPITVL